MVGLACLAMGDTQAVEIAQTCHVGLCVQNKILDESTLLAMNLPPPRSRTSTGIVIDDFVSVTIEARSLEEVSRSPTESAMRGAARFRDPLKLPSSPLM